MNKKYSVKNNKKGNKQAGSFKNNTEICRKPCGFKLFFSGSHGVSFKSCRFNTTSRGALWQFTLQNKDVLVGESFAGDETVAFHLEKPKKKCGGCWGLLGFLVWKTAKLTKNSMCFALWRVHLPLDFARCSQLEIGTPPLLLSQTVFTSLL